MDLIPSRKKNTEDVSHKHFDEIKQYTDEKSQELNQNPLLKTLIKEYNDKAISEYYKHIESKKLETINGCKNHVDEVIACYNAFTEAIKTALANKSSLELKIVGKYYYFEDEIASVDRWKTQNESKYALIKSLTKQLKEKGWNPSLTVCSSRDYVYLVIRCEFDYSN